MYSPINKAQDIMQQINAADFNTTLFTDRIGEDLGTTQRSSLGFLFNRLWAWIKGVSYDKNAVVQAVNGTFQRVRNGDLKNCNATQLKEFKSKLITLEKKFNHNGTLNTSFESTIKKITKHLSSCETKKASPSSTPKQKKTPQRSTNKKRVHTKPSPLRPAPSILDQNMEWINTLPADMQSVLGRNQDWLGRGEAKPIGHYLVDIQLSQAEKERVMAIATITMICEEIGTQYLDVSRSYYGSDSPELSRLTSWIEEARQEVYTSAIAHTNVHPIQRDETQQHFEVNLYHKICDYNLNKIETVIPNFFDTPGIDQKHKWLPHHDKSDVLGKFMTMIPFSDEVITHIKQITEEITNTAQTAHEDRQIRSLENQLKTQSDETILNLQSPYEKRDIVKAYYKQSLKFHPDKCQSQSPLEQKRATLIFQRINTAHQNLIERLERAHGA